MGWQPYIEFRTGHTQESWNKLTPAEQKEIYVASGKHRKPKLSVVEDQDPIVAEEKSSLPIRLVTRTELDRMPVYQNNSPA